ncbi:MAG: DUF2892 domain-containing protein [Flavobacteriales bacterium]|nr:DUF2892 domain-containing protein [Flavobacteriales bacterium]
MKPNMGSVDRIIRIVLAIAFIGLYAMGTVSGTLGTVLLVLGIVFLGTALVRFCPLYAPFGISTCPTKKA